MQGYGNAFGGLGGLLKDVNEFYNYTKNNPNETHLAVHLTAACEPSLQLLLDARSLTCTSRQFAAGHA